MELQVFTLVVVFVPFLTFVFIRVLSFQDLQERIGLGWGWDETEGLVLVLTLVLS
jgi:hypothetical protein